MIKFFISSHGHFASGLKSSVDILLGGSDNVTVFDAYVNKDSVKDHVDAFYNTVKPEDKVFLLSDIYGGSVNQALYLYKDRPNTTLIAGVNLALVLSLVSKDEISDDEVEQIVAESRNAMQIVKANKVADDNNEEFLKDEGEKEMIPLIRLDERMIHGQVAIKWSRHLSVDRIVVVNDKAASNSIIKESLMMAAPATAKTAIKGVEDSIKLLNDPRGASHKMLVIVSNPDDLLKIIQNVPDIPLVNVGNYGRVASKVNGEERKTYRRNLYAYDSEVAVLKKVIATGIKCVYQTIPDDAPEDLAKVLG